MDDLAPLETLFTIERGSDLPLPPGLLNLFGRLQFPPHQGRPYVIGNFVTTLDGVVTLNEQGHVSGGDISGFNRHDKMVMGLLRATADAVIVGAGTLRSAPKHLWTAEYIYPPLSDAYRQLRMSLGKSAQPLNVIVSAHANINLDLPVFQSGVVPVLVVTTPEGAQRIREHHLPRSVQVFSVQTTHGADSLDARAILEAVNNVQRSEMILIEGGPQLMGNFFAEQAIDELFLTLAPQIAGRDEHIDRPGLVAGKRFAPEHPLWGTLIGVKRGGSHLFLRYAFASNGMH